MLFSGRLMAADFDLGVAAFKAQDYARAIDYFEQAREQGVDSPVLHYNLAVSYFKQQRYDLARAMFERAAEDSSLAAISHYNLGLIALKTAQPDAAKQAFKQSFLLAEDERLRLLAARRLEQWLPEADKARPAPRATASSPLSGFFSIGWVRDSNVRHVNGDLPNEVVESDRYLDIFGLFNYRLTGTRRQGLQLKLGFVSNQYDKLSTYDQQTLNAGLYYHTPLAGWQTRSGLHYYRDKLDGSPYQRRLVAQWRADYRYTRTQRVRILYDLSQYRELDTRYAYLSGLRHRLQFDHRYRKGSETVRLGYKLELNKREDLDLNSRFISVSPTRHTLYARWRHRFNSNWSSDLALDYRASEYDNSNIINGVDQGIRREQRRRLALAGRYRINKSTELEARWRYTNNGASIASERYTNHQLMMAANLYF